MNTKINFDFPSIYENSNVINASMYNDHLILRKESVCQKVYGIDERLELDTLYNLKGKYVASLDTVENNLTFIKDLEDVTHTLGFSPKEQKWYGWSHRAYYGFGIGSTVKKGDCAYEPDTLENLIERTCNFWDITGKELNYGDNSFIKTPKGTESTCDGNGTAILVIYYTEQQFDKNHNLVLTLEKEEIVEIPKNYGRGEWTAETLEDAKQMAMDFARGVS